jgi:esterase/lipase superfamily enzyme
MRLLRYGNRGAPLIYAPSSGGDETEFECYGMHVAAAPWIESGSLQVFSIDACGPTGLFAEALAPRERMAAYVRFERQARDELVPFVLSESGASTLAVAGSSYGAFVAANLLLKCPGPVSVACGLGGVYGLWHRLDGHHDDDVYFHTPLEYLPRLEDPAILAAIRATGGLWLYGAATDPWLSSTLQMATVLRDRGLPHRVGIWAEPAGHHERVWSAQLVDFLGRLHGEKGRVG